MPDALFANARTGRNPFAAFVAVMLVSAVTAQTATWLARTTNTAPASTAPTLAYDVDHAVSLAYWPQAQATWLYDGIAWRQVTTAHAPSHSVYAVACHDPVRHRVIVVTGNRSASALATWEWDGSDWTQAASGGPSPRDGHAIAFDAARGVALLFGGTTNSNNGLGDTWAWNGSAWQQVGSGGPAPRWGHSMTFDEQRGVVVLFGGTGRPTGNQVQLDDTWEWNGSYWYEHFGIATPGRRAYAGLTYDTRRHRTVLFGGFDNNSLHDTWEWDGTTWRAIATAATPNNQGVLLTFDRARGTGVLVDFFSTVSTWEYVTATGPAASYTAFGSGCAGPAGVPTLAAVNASVPRLGGAFQARLSNLPSSLFNLPFLMLGFDATSWNGVPLPIALDAIGFPGCQAWIAPAFTTALGNANGAADWSLAVPLDLDLLGAEFYLQGAVMVPTWNPGGLVFSNAGHGVVGAP